MRAELQASRFFERFPGEARGRRRHARSPSRGRADFALYVWTIYNAVAWFDYWVDKSREVRVG
jgi:hypothetical protein